MIEEVRYRDREWVFPRGDCVLLPIENTTAELLARYIGIRLLADLQTHYQYQPAVLRVEVEETVGQFATYEWRASLTWTGRPPAGSPSPRRGAMPAGTSSLGSAVDIPVGRGTRRGGGFARVPQHPGFRCTAQLPAPVYAAIYGTTPSGTECARIA